MIFFFSFKKKDIYIPYKEIRKKKSKRKLNTCLDPGSEATFGHPPLPLHHYYYTCNLFKKILEALLFILWQISTW